jgi:uncharacterized protein (TIGR00369 family)
VSEANDLAVWQSRLNVSPFQRFLGLEAEAVGEGFLALGLDWREELMSNPHTHSAHGGVLASIIDLGGFYAILTAKAMAVATVDLHVDYLRPFTQGRLRSESSVVRIGSKVSAAETKIFDASRKLLASGRGAYLMGN